jgi:hypothetical protein
VCIDRPHHSKASLSIVAREHDDLNEGIARPQVVELEKPLDERERHTLTKGVSDPLVLVVAVRDLTVLSEVRIGLSEVKQGARRNADNQSIGEFVRHRSASDLEDLHDLVAVVVNDLDDDLAGVISLLGRTGF